MEHFGDGVASYVDVRDRFEVAEHHAWLSFFLEHDDRAAATKAQVEHDAVMEAASKGAE